MMNNDNINANTNDEYISPDTSSFMGGNSDSIATRFTTPVRNRIRNRSPSIRNRNRNRNIAERNNNGVNNNENVPPEFILMNSEETLITYTIDRQGNHFASHEHNDRMYENVMRVRFPLVGLNSNPESSRGMEYHLRALEELEERENNIEFMRSIQRNREDDNRSGNRIVTRQEQEQRIYHSEIRRNRDIAHMNERFHNDERLNYIRNDEVNINIETNNNGAETSYISDVSQENEPQQNNNEEIYDDISVYGSDAEFDVVASQVSTVNIPSSEPNSDIFVEDITGIEYRLTEFTDESVRRRNNRNRILRMNLLNQWLQPMEHDTYTHNMYNTFNHENTLPCIFCGNCTHHFQMCNHDMIHEFYTFFINIYVKDYTMPMIETDLSVLSENQLQMICVAMRIMIGDTKEQMIEIILNHVLMLKSRELSEYQMHYKDNKLKALNIKCNGDIRNLTGKNKEIFVIRPFLDEIEQEKSTFNEDKVKLCSECPICYDEPVKKMTTKNCLHTFCNSCAHQHFNKSNDCPMCRTCVDVLYEC